jgi:hypothetical protein
MVNWLPPGEKIRVPLPAVLRHNAPATKRRGDVGEQRAASAASRVERQVDRSESSGPRIGRRASPMASCNHSLYVMG